MSVYHPTRGGSRGGQDQFDWEDVKADKYRENYLGHSLKASVGRWQKGKDLTWYTKASKVTSKMDSLRAEVAAVKRAEEEAMAAALGLKPSAPVQPQASLSRQELAEVTRRRSTEEVDEREERMKGVGFQSRRAQMMYGGVEKTTTKEGATIFEHDDQSEQSRDGKLKLGSKTGSKKHRDRSQEAEPPTKISKGETEGGRGLQEDEAAHSERSSKHKKKHKKEKKLKKHKREKREERKERGERSRRHDSDSSNEDEGRQQRRDHRHHQEEYERDRQQQKRKRRRHDSSSDSN